MANIQYRLSAKMTGDAAEVLARFYSGTINLRAGTGIYIAPQSWDSKQGRCLISRRYETPANAAAREAQQELDELSAYIYNRYTTTPPNSQKWLTEVVADFHQPQRHDPPLHTRIEAYCSSRNVAPATAKKIRSLGTLLSQFSTISRPLTASTINLQDLDRFAAFLRSRGQTQNSINGRLRQLRTLVYWAGKPTPNPFDTYQIAADNYAAPIYLTIEERDYLAAFPDLSLAKRIQRDIFIFQCHTGCRVADLYNLTADNIRDGWLVYVPRKTSRHHADTIEVPLSPTALAIVERYRGVDKHNRLLPFISSVQYNKAITYILHEARVDRPVIVLDPKTYTTKAVPLWQVATSHTARKTFTQAVYSATGDKRLTAALTGHSENSQAFNRYSEISRQMKHAAIFGGFLARFDPEKT